MNAVVLLLVHTIDMEFVLGKLVQIGYSDKRNYLFIKTCGAYAEESGSEWCGY